MYARTTSHQMAWGIFIVSLLCLLVGLWNAGHQGQTTLKSGKDLNQSAGGVSALLNQGAHLARIDLSGVITMDPGKENGLFSNEQGAVGVLKALDAAAKDNSVRGVLLHINSPGGTVAMSQELNAAVKRVREKKPIVVSMGDLTASGGYYTACAADRIVANAGTLTASIGVIINSIEFSDLMNNKLGIHAVTVKSGQFKDLLSPYRKPTPAELSLLQTVIQQSYQDFLGAVIDGRTRLLTNASQKEQRANTIRAVADGRVVTGRQALAAGLVDEIGDEDHAYTVLDNMAKTRFRIHRKDRLPLESTEKGFNVMDFLGLTNQSSSSSNAANPLAQAAEMLPVSLRYPNQPLWIMQ